MTVYIHSLDPLLSECKKTINSHSAEVNRLGVKFNVHHRDTEAQR
jgi:hypothetical protein